VRLYAGHLSRGTYHYRLIGQTIDRIEQGSFVVGGVGR